MTLVERFAAVVAAIRDDIQTIMGRLGTIPVPERDNAGQILSAQNGYYELIDPPSGGGGLPTTVDSPYEGLNIVYGYAGSLPDPAIMPNTIYVALPERYTGD